MMIKITSGNLEEEVIKAKKPVIIDLWAPWCMPCQLMEAVFEEASKELTDYKFAKINVDEEKSLAFEFMVTSIPLIIIYHEGEEIARFTGYKTKEELIKEIKEAIMKDEMEED